MVTVPGPQNLGTVQPSIANQTPQTALAGEGAFGVQNAQADQDFGRAVAKAGDMASDIILQEKIDDNKRELKEALVAQSKLEKTIFFGDGTKENPGFSNLSGQAAIDGLQTARQAYTQGQENIAKGLTSTVQRQRFAAASAQAGVDAQARLNDHTSKQRAVANLRTAKARQQEAKDNAVFDFRNDDRMATNFAIVQAEALTVGSEAGLTGQALVSHVEKAVSEVAVQAVEAAIAAGDIARGRKLLAQYKKGGQLDGTDIPALTKALQEGTVKFSSQEFTDAIIGQGQAEGWTPQQFMAAARAVEHKDPEVRLATVRRVTLFNAEQARAKREAVTDAGLAASQFVEGGGQMTDFNSGQKALLGTDKLLSLEKHEARKATGAATVTQWERFNHYTLEVPRDEIKNIDLEMAQEELAPAQFAIVQRMVQAARTDTGTSGPADETSFSASQVFAAGIKNTPFAPKRGERSSATERRGQLQTLYQMDIEILERNNGPKRKTTATEKHKVLNDLMDRVVVGSIDFTFGLIDDEEPLSTVEVPLEERPKIVAAVEAKGQIATEANIRKMFLILQGL